ncbi:MAG: hypothetical protein N3D73_02265 [Candidatus Diapherotrites archaeon]|nr:hypothetical protein [Candidatus Diapherotrites archaeon]
MNFKNIFYFRSLVYYKKFYKILILLVFLNFSLNAFAENCQIRESCSSDFIPIFSVSGQSNAHASINPNYYTYKVCCPNRISGNNLGVLSLSNQNNAHIGSFNIIYPNKIYVNSSYVIIRDSCLADEICLVSFKGFYNQQLGLFWNAHIYDCSCNNCKKVCLSNAPFLDVWDVEINTDKKLYYVGDTVRITISVTNKSNIRQSLLNPDNTLELHISFNPQLSRLAALYPSPNNPSYEIQPFERLNYIINYDLVEQDARNPLYKIDVNIDAAPNETYLENNQDSTTFYVIQRISSIPDINEWLVLLLGLLVVYIISREKKKRQEKYS